MKKKIHRLALMCLIFLTSCTKPLNKDSIEKFLYDRDFEMNSLIYENNDEILDEVDLYNYSNGSIKVTYIHSDDSSLSQYYSEKIISQIIKDKKIKDEYLLKDSSLLLTYEEKGQLYRVENYYNSNIYLVLEYMDNEINKDVVAQMRKKFNFTSEEKELVTSTEKKDIDYGLSISLKELVDQGKISDYSIISPDYISLSQFRLKQELEDKLVRKDFIESLSELPSGNNLDSYYRLEKIDYLIINIEGKIIALKVSKLDEDAEKELVNIVINKFEKISNLSKNAYLKLLVSNHEIDINADKPDILLELDTIKEDLSKEYSNYLKELKDLTFMDKNLLGDIISDEELEFTEIELLEEEEKYFFDINVNCIIYDEEIDKLYELVEKEVNKDGNKAINISEIIKVWKEEIDPKKKSKNILFGEESNKEDIVKVIGKAPKKIEEDLKDLKDYISSENRRRKEAREWEMARAPSIYRKLEEDEDKTHPDPRIASVETVQFVKKYDMDGDGIEETIYVKQIENYTGDYLAHPPRFISLRSPKGNDSLRIDFDEGLRTVLDMNFYEINQNGRKFGVLVLNTSNHTGWSHESYVITVKDGKLHKSDVGVGGKYVWEKDGKLYVRAPKMAIYPENPMSVKAPRELIFNSKTMDFEEGDLIYNLAYD